jgi:hypothetical protein
MSVPDNIIAGLLMICLCVPCILWYLFVLIRGMYHLSKTQPTFIIFFSCGICEISYILNSLWFGTEILVGPSILLSYKYCILYSLSLNLMSRANRLHYPALAINRLFAVSKPTAFTSIFTRKFNIYLCLILWLFTVIEVIIWHSIFNVDVYIIHNITSYNMQAHNGTAFNDSPIPTYQNVRNYILSAITIVCDFGSILALLIRKIPRQKGEVRIFCICLVNNIAIFSPQVARMFEKNVSKWVNLAHGLFDVCTLVATAVLLPIFCTALRETLFRKKQSTVHSGILSWQQQRINRTITVIPRK